MIFCGNYKIFKTIKKLRELRILRKTSSADFYTLIQERQSNVKAMSKECQRNVKGKYK